MNRTNANLVGLFLFYDINTFTVIDFPNDTGPIYRETLEGRFPVEPFNTFSNLIFLVLLVYWGLKVYRNPRQHTFLAWVLPVIGISYVGGTIYHATRSHEFWLLLDWVPIMLLCMALVVYFIFKLVASWWHRLLFCILLFGTSFVLRLLPLPKGLQISLGYVITALTILIPLVSYLIKTDWQHLRWISYAFFFFGVAVFFRSIDLRQDVLPMGTHWLWHLLGGVAVHFFMVYVFKDNSLNLSARKVANHD